MPDSTHLPADGQQTQLSLFDAPRPPRSTPPTLPPAAPGSATSRDAALSIADLAPGLRGRVYAYVVARKTDGATREEISIGSGLRLSTVAARCNELVRLGLLCEDGTRPTTSGRNAAVLYATGKTD